MEVPSDFFSTISEEKWRTGRWSPEGVGGDEEEELWFLNRRSIVSNWSLCLVGCFSPSVVTSPYLWPGARLLTSCKKVKVSPSCSCQQGGAWGRWRRRTCRREERKPLRGWTLKTFSVKIDHQWPFILFVLFETTFTFTLCENGGWAKDFSCCLHVIRARCRNMSCCRIKLIENLNWLLPKRRSEKINKQTWLLNGLIVLMFASYSMNIVGKQELH